MVVVVVVLVVVEVVVVAGGGRWMVCGGGGVIQENPWNPWVPRESVGTHGIRGYQRNPWVSMESMVLIMKWKWRQVSPSTHRAEHCKEWDNAEERNKLPLIAQACFTKQ